MSFCPKCKYEYRSDVNHCPDCDVDLIDVLPEELKTKWIPIGVLYSRIHSQMLEEALRDAGIPAVIYPTASYYTATGGMEESMPRPGAGNYTVLVGSTHIDEADHLAESILGDQWLRARCKK